MKLSKRSHIYYPADWSPLESLIQQSTSCTCFFSNLDSPLHGFGLHKSYISIKLWEFNCSCRHIFSFISNNSSQSWDLFLWIGGCIYIKLKIASRRGTPCPLDMVLSLIILLKPGIPIMFGKLNLTINDICMYNLFYL